MNKVITYAINREDGLVVSRVGSQLAWPVVQYDQIGEKGNFNGPINIKLENIPVTSVGQEWGLLRWTKKIPVVLKNQHRKHWGFSLLPVPSSEKMN